MESLLLVARTKYSRFWLHVTLVAGCGSKWKDKNIVDLCPLIWVVQL